MAYILRYCDGYQFNVGGKKYGMSSNLDELRERIKPQVLRRLKTEISIYLKNNQPIFLKLKSKNYENEMGEYFDWYEKSEDSSSLTIQLSKLMKIDRYC